MISGRMYFGNEEGFVVNTDGKQLVNRFSPRDSVHRGISGKKYPHVCIAGKERFTHLLICAAWWGKRRKGQQCHHLNGNIRDSRPSNLIWLSIPRHRLYDARLKALKALLGDQGVLIFSRQDFIRFARMSEANFQSMLAKFHRADPDEQIQYELTHHMECEKTFVHFQQFYAGLYKFY